MARPSDPDQACPDLDLLTPRTLAAIQVRGYSPLLLPENK